MALTEKQKEYIHRGRILMPAIAGGVAGYKLPVLRDMDISDTERVLSGIGGAVAGGLIGYGLSKLSNPKGLKFEEIKNKAIKQYYKNATPDAKNTVAVPEPSLVQNVGGPVVAGAVVGGVASGGNPVGAGIGAVGGGVGGLINYGAAHLDKHLALKNK